MTKLIFKLSIILITSNVLFAQIPCDPKIAPDSDPGTFKASLSGSDNALTGNINGSGWEAVSGTSPDILITPWTLSSAEGGTGSTTSSIIKVGNIADYTSNNTDNKILGALHGEGIKKTFELEGSPNRYLLRFSQTNARKHRENQPPASARWVVKVEETGDEHRSILMPVTRYEILKAVNWHNSLVVIEVPTSGTYTISFTAEDFTDKFFSNLTLGNNSQREANYMLLDNISLIKEGECEYPLALTGKDNSSFMPEKNKDYVLTAWLKESFDTTSGTPLNYLSEIEISFGDGTVEYASPSGAIIDGWQRIEHQFTIPEESTAINITLTNARQRFGYAVYYDDIRIHRSDGTMKSFVYDPETQRLMAELDENNYATLYEYDNEGGLVRVKKETERGIYTIQETRSGNSKLNVSN